MEKNKVIFFVLISTILVGLGFLVFDKLKVKNQNQKQISTMPDFHFFDSLGNIASRNHVSSSQGTVVFYYNSTCSLCEEEFYFIRESLDEFENTQLIFVSTEEFKDIRSFATKYDLWGKDQVHFFQDKDLSFGTFFILETVPSTLVYDREDKLLGSYKGIVSIKNLIELLNEGS